jgi:hypothetical protein
MINNSKKEDINNNLQENSNEEAKDGKKLNSEDNFVKRGIILIIFIIIFILIYSFYEEIKVKNISYLEKISTKWQQVDNNESINIETDKNKDVEIAKMANEIVDDVITDVIIDQELFSNNKEYVNEDLNKYKLSHSYLKFKDKLLLSKDLSKEFAFLKDQLINSGFEDDITKFEKIVKYYQNDKILSDNFKNISPKLIARDRNDPEDGFINKFRFNLNSLILIKGSKNNKSLSKIEKFIFLAQNLLEIKDYKNLIYEINQLDVAFQDILSKFSKQIDVKILIEEFDNKYIYS